MLHGTNHTRVASLLAASLLGMGMISTPALAQWGHDRDIIGAGHRSGGGWGSHRDHGLRRYEYRATVYVRSYRDGCTVRRRFSGVVRACDAHEARHIIECRIHDELCDWGRIRSVSVSLRRAHSCPDDWDRHGSHRGGFRIEIGGSRLNVSGFADADEGDRFAESGLEDFRMFDDAGEHASDDNDGWRSDAAEGWFDAGEDENEHDIDRSDAGRSGESRERSGFDRVDRAHRSDRDDDERGGVRSGRAVIGGGEAVRSDLTEQLRRREIAGAGRENDADRDRSRRVVGRTDRDSSASPSGRQTGGQAAAKPDAKAPSAKSPAAKSPTAKAPASKSSAGKSSSAAPPATNQKDLKKAVQKAKGGGAPR